MDQVAYNLPLEQNLPSPDYASDEMGKAVSLANAMDQRRANQGATQRATNVRSALGQPGMVADNGTYNPQAVQAVNAIDPDKAQELTKFNNDEAFKKAQTEYYNNRLTPQLRAQALKSQADNNRILSDMLNSFDAKSPTAGQDWPVLVDAINRTYTANGEDSPIKGFEQFDPIKTPIVTSALINRGYSVAKQIEDQAKKTTAEAAGTKAGAAVTTADSKAAVVPSVIDKNNATTGLINNQAGVVQQGADAKTLQAQAAMTRAKNMPAGGSGGTSSLTPDEEQALNNAMFQGGLDPKWINSRTAKIFANQEMLNPGKQWNSASAAAAFERSQSTMNTKSILNTIDPLLDQLLTSGKALGNSPLPLVNGIVNWGKAQTGDPGIVDFNNRRDDVVAEVERGLLGTGVLSDSKYNRAIKNVNSAQTYPQLQSAINATRSVIEARMEAMRQGPNTGAAGQELVKQPGSARNSGTTAKTKGNPLGLDLN